MRGENELDLVNRVQIWRCKSTVLVVNITTLPIMHQWKTPHKLQDGVPMNKDKLVVSTFYNQE